MMAAEANDLAADLLAALGSSVVEEPLPTLQSPSNPQPTTSTTSTTSATSIAPAPIPNLAGTTAAPSEPIPTTASVAATAAPAIERPPDPGSAPSPKRQRTPDLAGLGNVKRQKTEHEPSNIDMAMLLESALGSFDEQLNPPMDAPVLESHTIEETPAVRSATATPAPAKLEPRLMKASDNPLFMMRSMSLPVLGNLAVQILLRLAQQPRADTEALLADKNTEFLRTYETLKSVFLPTRTVFSESSLLLSCEELDITDSEDRETIRMSNLATVGLSLFDTQDLALREIHDQFLSIFVPELSEYKEFLTDFYISLKTHVFIRAKDDLGNSQSNNAQLLGQYFPVDFEESLKQRNGEIFLNFSEDMLVAAVRERRETLAKVTSGEETNSSSLKGADEMKPLLPSVSLIEQYPAQELLNDFSLYLQSHLSTIVEYAEKYGVNIPVAEDGAATLAPMPIVSEPVVTDDLAALLQSATAKMNEEPEVHKMEEPVVSDGLGLSSIIQESLNSEMDLASLIRENLGEATEAKAHASYTMPSYASINGEVNGQPQFQSLAQLNQLHASPYHSYTQTAPQVTHTVTETGDLLPPNQSSPTAVLYERARQAAVAKSSSSTRREGLHSTRRPWTPEEEKALMAGLDMVKGPHWSQILSLFGVNGTVSDILKDRTQVQLKDKARNLKLFFLKTSSEMPYYLQSVTGELKTRAPSQAARKEAEEKARVNSEEEQARLQGIMTLASGLQNNHPNTRSPISTSTPVQGSPLTPRVGPVGIGGAPTPGGPANIAPAPAPGLAKSPDIKSEPADHSGVSHSLAQNGLPISQQLAQIHSRVKQEVHGLPQIQPRIPTPHAPLAPAPQPQAQTQTQGHSLPQHQNVSRPASQPTTVYPAYRPPQASQAQAHQQQPQPPAQVTQSTQVQTLVQAQVQQSAQDQLSTGVSQPSMVQTPAQTLAQALQLPQSQPQPQPEVQAAPSPHVPIASNSGEEQAGMLSEPFGHHSADDSAEASLLETLRAAMASAPESHTPMVTSETPAA